MSPYPSRNVHAPRQRTAHLVPPSSEYHYALAFPVVGNACTRARTRSPLTFPPSARTRVTGPPFSRRQGLFKQSHFTSYHRRGNAQATQPAPRARINLAATLFSTPFVSPRLTPRATVKKQPHCSDIQCPEKSYRPVKINRGESRTRGPAGPIL